MTTIKLDLKNNFTLYHYSSKKLHEVCPPFLIKDKSVKFDKRNTYTISLFPNKIPIEYIQQFRNNGFIRYEEMNDLYLMEISLKDVIKNMKYFRYESKKEPLLEIDKVFDKEKEILLKNSPNITSVEFEFFKENLKTTYYHKFGLIYASNEKDDFTAMLNNANENWLEDIEYNLKYGDKNQYASYIPHFVIETCKCVKTKKQTKIMDNGEIVME